MDGTAARRFADRWAADWNAGDVDGLLSHFADDAVFTSPLAVRVVPGSGGVLRGKDAIRAYWTAGLERIPGLHFDVEAVFAGVSTVVIRYRNHTGAVACEVLTFDGPLVVAGHGTYLSEDAAAASGVAGTG